MKRIVLTLATAGILCVAAAGQAMAHGHHHHHGFYRPGVVVVRPPVVVPRPVVVAPRYYAPVYPRCYHAAPAYGFYYQGRGLSIGVDF